MLFSMMISLISMMANAYFSQSDDKEMKFLEFSFDSFFKFGWKEFWVLEQYIKKPNHS